jgi:hypothetical protein
LLESEDPDDEDFSLPADGLSLDDFSEDDFSDDDFSEDDFSDDESLLAAGRLSVL